MNIEEEFGIIRGGLLSFNAFNGETEYHHGFFLVDNDNEIILCHTQKLKKYIELSENIITFYNPQSKNIDIFWDSETDGEFNKDIIMISEIKYVPFCYYKYLLNSEYSRVNLIKRCFENFSHDMKLFI